MTALRFTALLVWAVVASAAAQPRAGAPATAALAAAAAELGALFEGVVAGFREGIYAQEPGDPRAPLRRGSKP